MSVLSNLIGSDGTVSGIISDAKHRIQSARDKHQLLSSFRTHNVVTIIGGGQVGLAETAAMVRTSKRHIQRINVYDVDTRKVELLNQKKPTYIDDDYIKRAIKRSNGRVRSTADPSVIADSNVVIICVPTLINDDGSPNMRYVESAAQTVAKSIRPQTLVLVASTVHPLAFEENILPFFKEQDLKVGKDFFLAHPPERINPGSNYPSHTIPRVCGGHTTLCGEIAEIFLSHYIDQVVPVTDARHAAFVKLHENARRLCDIVASFEHALIAEEIDLDFTEIVRGASSKPYAYVPVTPGPGIGGQCIPVDPRYLAWMAQRLGVHIPHLNAAIETLSRMPEHTIRKTELALQAAGKPLGESVVAVLGNAYKENMVDRTGTPAEPIIRALRRRGAHVRTYDPLTLVGTHTSLGEVLDGADAVILVTPHKVLVQEFTPELLVERGVRVLMDARNALPANFTAHTNGSLQHVGIGRDPKRTR